MLGPRLAFYSLTEILPGVLFSTLITRTYPSRPAVTSFTTLG